MSAPRPATPRPATGATALGSRHMKVPTAHPTRNPTSVLRLSAFSLSIHTLLQLLKPVLDEDHAEWHGVRIAGCAGFEHQESLAVSRYVEMARGIWLGIVGVEELRRTADADRRFGCTNR